MPILFITYTCLRQNMYLGLMDDELDLLDDGAKPIHNGARPSFLTVLCILTFVGVGFSLIYGLFRFWQIQQMEMLVGAFGDLTDNIVDDSVSEPIYSTYRWIKISVYLSIFGALFCLTGAILMWRLRKIGFPIYVIGQIVPLVGTFFTYGSFTTGILAGFGFMILIVSLIFPLGFIIMYGLNYKYLR